MKKFLLVFALVLFVLCFYLLNATDNYHEGPVTTGWIFNDTGNCDLNTVSA